MSTTPPLPPSPQTPTNFPPTTSILLGALIIPITCGILIDFLQRKMSPSADPAPATDNNDHLIKSSDPKHPANLIPELCKKFWGLGWVTGTGGGASIRDDDLVYLAPSGVQKEMMKPEDIYVLSITAQQNPKSRIYLRSPPTFKPSQCTPLFMAAFTKRNARCCIHSHSQWAVLITLLLEQSPPTFSSSSSPNTNTHKIFEINNIEQIKAFGRGYNKTGNLGYHDTLRIPVIENTPFEEDLTESLEEAMDAYPDAYAVLVRRHGVYVWGDTVDRAKAQAESLDYLFQLAVEMKKLGMPWLSNIA